MRNVLPSLVLVSLLAGCGSEPPPPAAPPPPPAPVPVAVTPPPEPAKPAEPTAEEKKKAADLKSLEADRAKSAEENKVELARWTPELRAAATALATKSYPTGKAAIEAAAASKTRKPDSAERDKYRHPVATLEFFGFKPTMTVLEVGPGSGWYTELLAPALAKKGKYLATNTDPNGPADSRSTWHAQLFSGFLATSPEAYGKVETIITDGKPPKLGHEGTVDLVLAMRTVHGLVNSGTFAAWLSEIKGALKPGGVLGIEEHRAPVGANALETSKNGYVPEAYVIEQAEAAGFKLAGKSEINANPKDTKDYPEGVWTLPPTFKLKDKDHDKYAAIGESDRMTLKFVKAPAAKADKPAAAAAPKADATAAPKPAAAAAPKADAAAAPKPAATAAPKPAASAAPKPDKK
jgi:predicted methyltransferase